uniref:DUF7808 domain-containing protein n=1 Tax=Plectus sambesii TaxID=2011161 RepID=A0A914VP90_9BILA
MLRLKELCFLMGSVFLIDAGKIFLPTNYHVRPRFLVCNHEEGQNQAGCTLFVGKEKVEEDPQCFSELSKNGEPRSYCRLSADDADWCDPIFKVPNNNHKCNKFFNYETERRDDGWYIWRADKCLNQTISILVHCQWAQKSGSPPSASPLV